MKVIANNKKAYFDFFISDNTEAGIELKGSEVKSIRAGGISLNESYVRVVGNEIFLINAFIKPFEKSSSFVPDSRRTRKLLLRKSEIAKLSQKVSEKGLTIVPLKVYLKGNLVKVEIGIGKGKKLFDKRETLKEKTAQREIESASKNFRLGKL
ncbi:MAG: SsrA-binding protein SmpB [Firmicutes bacterium]|jgi:SsrA-binding protein|nr:SsrA-binding protein SmpB [Bacillota bacterium]MDY5586357.1 SsrA-binding protein SmpB [Eubacteriales bacterium]